MSKICEEKNLILFDTCSLEGIYLFSLLANKAADDIVLLIKHGYQPAITQRVLFELWYHAKTGKGNNQVWRKSIDIPYPDSLFSETVASIIRPIDPRCDTEQTAAFWFNLCEEWCDLYSDVLEDPECCPKWFDQPRQQFYEWKMKMVLFCKHIENVIIKAGFRIIYNYEIYTSQKYIYDGQSIEQSLSRDSIIPNEDFELILQVILLRANALVSCDSKWLTYKGRASLGFNVGPISFVHPKHLKIALEDRFKLAYYGKDNDII